VIAQECSAMAQDDAISRRNTMVPLAESDW
jgi:hypothetical protein